MSKRLAAIEAMIEKVPGDPFPRYARALELRSMKDLEGALAGLSETAQRFPDYVPTYLMAAQIAAELDQNAAARDFATRGLERARRVGDGHAASELGNFLATLPPRNSSAEE